MKPIDLLMCLLTQKLMCWLIDLHLLMLIGSHLSMLTQKLMCLLIGLHLSMRTD